MPLKSFSTGVSRAIVARLSKKGIKLSLEVKMDDLFTSQMSKKDRLYEFIKAKGRCATSQVIQWGTTNYCNRAERYARELAEEGRIWRMNDTVKLRSRWANSREELWSVVENDK